MTTPSRRQPSQAQQQQTQARLAILLASGVTAAALTPAVLDSLAAVGVGAAAARAALTLTGAVSAPVVLPLGPASRATAASEQTYRAAYLLAAALRVQQRIDDGATLQQAVTAEASIYRQHLAAQANRRATAQAVDKAADRHGTILGWRAVMDDRTSAECRRADGADFSVFSRPAIGWPGSVHPHCRCRPVVAFRNGRWVDNTVTEREKVAAIA